MYSFITEHWGSFAVALAVLGVSTTAIVSNPALALALIRKVLPYYWKEIVVVSAALAALWYVYELKSTITEQTKQLEINKVNLAVLTANSARLEAAVRDSNEIVKRFDKFTEDTQKQFAGLNKDVDTRNQALTSQIQRILREKKPQTCQEAIDYLIDHGGAK